MRIFKGILLAGMAVLLVAVMNPAMAACGAATTLGTDNAGSKSLIWNPGAGFNPNYGFPPYVFDYTPPVSANLEGNFWALGTGNPAGGAGDDSNGLPVGDWVSFYGPGAYGSYFAAELFGGWGASAQIDGCILNNGTGCTCVLLTDSAGGGSQYALLSAQANASGNTVFEQPGNDGAGNAGPIILAEIPAPTVVGSVKNGNGVDLTLGPITGLTGVYQKDGCDCAAGAVVRVLAREEPEGGAPPATRDASQWNEIGNGALGGPVAASAACDSFAAVDLYLTTQIVFDPASNGGYGGSVVSANSTRVSCGSNPTLADPVDIQRPRIKPGKPVTPRGEGRGRSK